jgi:hypothetical protein
MVEGGGMKRAVLLSFLSGCLGLGMVVDGQEVVRVGEGSYAAGPPVGKMVDGKTKVDAVVETEGRRLYLVEEGDRAVPSNKWYQNLLLKQYGTGMWAMPHRVDATKEGIEIFYSTSYSGDGVRALTEFPLVVGGEGFRPVDSRVKGWGDWSVAFRSYESEGRWMDVTLGEGMPTVWCEFRGVVPRLWAGGHGGGGSRAERVPGWFGVDGKPVTLPVKGEALGMRHEGRCYGISAPEGTEFAMGADGRVAVTFAGEGGFLVISLLPAEKDFAASHERAYAVPRDTRLDWEYDREAGRLRTEWVVETAPLRAGAKGVLQGFLPHQWRDNGERLELGGPEFGTIRGVMKCGAGDVFRMSHAFRGVMPGLPAVGEMGGAAERVSGLLREHFAETKKPLGTDTYWGGKDLQRYAQAALVAAEAGDGSRAAIEARLKESLSDWLSYKPGEAARYFAWYPRRKGLVGFNAAYGSEHFTDTHFHQGYFVHAAAVLSQLDAGFAKAYGEMAALVAKNYANWDRGDERFPRLRTFDVWRGHSYADGNGFPEGNNQESTGEAVNSWAALILLGEALGDEKMTAAGVMGYVFESRAAEEYWFDPHGDVFPAAYEHDACGMIWSGSIVWGTWFTASPSWIYGIQWVPSGPQLSFFGREPGLVERVYGGYEREQEAFEVKETARRKEYRRQPVTTAALGGELASYHLGFRMHGDAAKVVKELETLWNEPGDKVAHNEWMASVHWQAAALKTLGWVDWRCHGTSPVSMVYRNPEGGVRTMVAWNPGAEVRTVKFFEGKKQIGELSVPPRTMGSGVVR